MKPLRLLPWLAAWLLVMIAIMAMPAMAQSTATEPASAEEDAAESAESSPTSYEALANLLEDEQARQELIEMLRSQASALPDGIADELSPEAAAQGSEIAPEDVSLPRQLAELTSRVVSDVGVSLSKWLASWENCLRGKRQTVSLIWPRSSVQRSIWVL